MPQQQWEYHLPDVINPPRGCITIEIPLDFYHEAAFWRALSSLSFWFNWERDDQKQGTLAAQVWKEIYQKARDEYIRQGFACPVDSSGEFYLEDDMPLFRQQGCKLQVQCPDGNWDTIYDPTDCVAEIAQKTASNPSGVTNPQPGQCYTYPVALSGRDIWYSPVPLQDGDTIAFSNFAGAWNDGTTTWYCPDGTPYVLNLCIGAKGHVSSDPSSTLFHGQLAGFLSAATIDPFAGATTISGTPAPAQLVLQMNDAIIGDNTGSISFTVEICKAQAAAGTWERIIDLTASNGGFVPNSSNEGTWVSGQGWTPGDEFDGSNWARHLQLQKNITSCILTYLEFDYVVSRGAEIVPLDDQSRVNGSNVATHNNASGTIALVWSGQNNAAVSIGFNSYISQQGSHAALSGSETLYRVVLRGIGAPPF
jgi:hypothetical protein